MLPAMPASNSLLPFICSIIPPNSSKYLDSSNGVLYVNQIEHIEDKNQFIIYTKRRN